MNISKLLRLLLAAYLRPGIVEATGGGAEVVEEEGDEAAEGDEAGEDGAEGDGDEGAETGGTEGSTTDEAGEGATGAAAGEGADDEIVVTIGEEASAEDDANRAPEWVRELRKSNREKDRRIRELEAKEAARTAAPQALVVGEEPTLEGCDFDAEKYAKELKAWVDRKRQADDEQRDRAQAAEKDRARWQTRLDAVNTAASTLKVKDNEDASQAFEDLFSVVQQGVVLDGPDDAKDSALLRYALGKNPSVAKKLAAIQNPIRYAFAVAKVLYKDLNVKPRKAAPPPDKRVQSGVAGATAIADTELARLQAQADKTGDRSKVAAYLRQKQRVAQTA